MFKLVIAAGLLAYLMQTNEACKDCTADTTSLICISETAYELCVDGAKTGAQISCETGKVCSDGICRTPADTVVADCASSSCNKCTGNFACVSKTEFAVCENTLPTDVILTCPNNKICDITDAKLCVACTGTPTCSNTVFKKPDPAVDYADSCGTLNEGEHGYYKNKYDTTCKTYVFCQQYNGELVSYLYNCTSKYFDTVKMDCVSTKPSGCV